jgi:hypothetical protein
MIIGIGEVAGFRPGEWVRPFFPPAGVVFLLILPALQQKPLAVVPVFRRFDLHSRIDRHDCLGVHLLMFRSSSTGTVNRASMVNMYVAMTAVSVRPRCSISSADKDLADGANTNHPATARAARPIMTPAVSNIFHFQ